MRLYRRNRAPPEVFTSNVTYYELQFCFSLKKQLNPMRLNSNTCCELYNILYCRIRFGCTMFLCVTTFLMSLFVRFYFTGSRINTDKIYSVVSYKVTFPQGWEFAHLLIAHRSFAHFAQIKWATMSDLLRSLKTNEQPWAIRSGRSEKMSKWAIPSKKIFG